MLRLFGQPLERDYILRATCCVGPACTIVT